MSRMSVKQAAERVGVSESLVYQWCQEKRLPHLRLGRAGKRGKILIAEADLAAFLDGLTVRAGEDQSSPALKYITLR